MLDSVPQLAKAELFGRLADGHAARTTVVTPNRRLAQTLMRDFDQHQLAHGRVAWETADILPYAAFVERLHEDARYSPHGAGLPLLLTADQEHSLWEEIVRRADGGSALLAVPETAALAREAWQLAHEWQLLGALHGAVLDQDSAAFAEWGRQYAERTQHAGFTDRARLPPSVVGRLDAPGVKRPDLLVVYAFDHLTPQQQAFFAALAAHGVQLVRCGPLYGVAKQAVRVAALDARDEIRRAAGWARARLEANPAARIGIVVLDLGRRKPALRRALEDALAPGSATAPWPFNISLGEPLTAYPLVAHALIALALGGREVELERASVLMRSPFIGGAEDERERRAALDALLRRRAERVLTLDGLVGLLTGELAQKLDACAEFRRRQLSSARSPGEWAPVFTDALALLGFPGQRALDSAEYQTLAKWHELLGRFAGLERVVPRIDFDHAVARLQRMAAQTLFQPETPAVPIQVLGALEAAGMEFDHLWVMGLTDDAWPLPARPNPFLPLPVQRAAQMPHASPSAALEAAQRLTADWLSCADDVVLSYSRREADCEFAASPLIANVSESTTPPTPYAGWREVIHRSRRIVQLADAEAPPFRAAGPLRGGATLVKNQSACAFRAFAIHRLAARGIEAPQTGLDQSRRGMLVHLVLANVWRVLQSKRALQACAESELQAVVVRAVTDAMTEAARRGRIALGRRFAQIERARLIKLARDWLEFERMRPDFTVVAIEEERAIALGPLELRVRLDRVDETPGGARIVLDYKTGDAKLAAICGPRPDEPQLPLYVTAGEPGAAAAALAQLRPDKLRFVGLALDPYLLPGVASPDQADRRAGAARTWSLQLEQWETELRRLAGEFAAGHAAANPKNGLNTCRTCGLQALCRIHERLTREAA